MRNWTSMALLLPILGGVVSCRDAEVGDPGGMGGPRPDTAPSAEVPARDVLEGVGVGGAAIPREGGVVDTAVIDTTARIDG